MFKAFPEKFVKKGVFLLQPGEMTNTAFYVEKGCLRSYVIDNNGKEHIYQFAPEDWLISDEEALLDKKPAILFIDTIEDSVIKIVSLKEMRSNLDLDTAIHSFNRMEKKVNAFRRRIIQLLSATAEERYSTFIKTYPNLTNRVPQKMIASYLGITPESLSRIRKNRVSRK